MSAPSATPERRSVARIGAPLVVVLLMGAVLTWTAWLGRAEVQARTPGEPAAQFQIDSPADGARVTDRALVVAGSGAPPAAEVTVTARDQVVTGRADPDGTWRLTTAPLAVGPVAIGATTQVDGQQVVAVPDPVGILIIPETPTITAPEDGVSIRERRPAIHGAGAEPGAAVLVEIDGEERDAPVADAGDWAVQLTTDLAIGEHEIRVRQVLWEVSSDVATRQFQVIDSPTPTPTGRPPTRPPPTGPPATGRPPAPSLSGPSLSSPSRTGATRDTTTRAAGADQSSGPAATVTTGAPQTAADGEGVGPPAPEPGDPEPGDPESSDRAATADVPTAAPTARPGAAVALVPLRFSLAAGTLTPGRPSTMIGALGPTTDSRSATVTVSGRLNRGVRYLSVAVSPDARCSLTAQHFTCTVVLSPGQRATVRLRLLADEVRGPRFARQQLQVRAGTGPVNNLTRTTRIDHGPTDTATWAASIGGGPGPVIALLLIYLLALAAVEWERRRTPAQPSPSSPPEEHHDQR